MITNDSYSFVESATSGEEWHVKLKEGDYAGVVYKYGKIQIVEPPMEGDDARLQFQYLVVDAPEHLSVEELQHDTTFMNYLGDILTHIIQDSLETGQFKLGENDKSTDSKSTMH